MKSHNFPALIFLTIAYCLGFIAIAAVLTIKAIAAPSPKSPTTEAGTAKSLAPIFTKPAPKPRRGKRTMAQLIKEVAA